MGSSPILRRNKETPYLPQKPINTGFSRFLSALIVYCFSPKMHQKYHTYHMKYHTKRGGCPPLSLFNHSCLNLPSRSAPANPLYNLAAPCVLLPILPWYVSASRTSCKMPRGSFRIFPLSPVVYSASRLSFLSFRISTMITTSSTIMMISLIIFIAFIRIPPFA